MDFREKGDRPLKLLVLQVLDGRGLGGLVNDLRTQSSSRHNVNPVTAEVGPSQALLEAEAAIRSIAECQNKRVRWQLKDVERELDVERQWLKDVEREKVCLEKMAGEEREKRVEREREKERERGESGKGEGHKSRSEAG